MNYPLTVQYVENHIKPFFAKKKMVVNGKNTGVLALYLGGVKQLNCNRI